MKLPKWTDFTTREKWLAGIALLGAALFVGSIVARLFVPNDLNWDAVTAVIAFTALIIAVGGYWDNRRGQQLEHRAYLRLAVTMLNLKPDDPVDLAIEIVNYGRSPAHKVQTKIAVGIYLDDINTMPVPARPQVLTETSIHPGAAGYVYTDGGFTITQAEYNAVKDDKTMLAVRILCLYEDIFGNQHETHLLGRMTNFGGAVRVHNAHVGNWAN